MGKGGILFLDFGFGAQHVIVDDCLVHTNGVLPVVTASGKLAGILDAGLVTGIHILAQHFEAYAAHINHCLIHGVHALLHFALGEVTFCAAGEAHNHGVVTFVQTFDGDGQELRRFQGYIAFTVFSRLSVGIGIDTEHGEVARVARPHPVVGLTAKLTYRGGRSGNHTHVAVYLIIEHIEFVSCIEGECAHFNARFTLQIALLQFFLCQFAEERGSQCIDFRHFACLYFSVDKVGDVYNAVHETEFQSRGGQFFTAVHGPETICQIIVFHAAVLLYGTVSAMVIGQNQSFRRDDFAGTATAKDTYSIFQ